MVKDGTQSGTQRSALEEGCAREEEDTRRGPHLRAEEQEQVEEGAAVHQPDGTKRQGESWRRPTGRCDI